MMRMAFFLFDFSRKYPLLFSTWQPLSPICWSRWIWREASDPNGFTPYLSMSLMLTLIVIGFLFFWTDSQKRIMFFKLSGNSWARLVVLSHVVVSDNMSVGT